MKDFDAFWAEQNNEKIPFKIFGQTEYLPPSLPATMVLKMARFEKEYGKNDLPPGEILELSTFVFGKGKVEEWCEKGLTVDQLDDLISWAMEQYAPGNPTPPRERGQE
jgi:hypothetical protein